MDKKITLIPGWMNTKRMYGDRYDVLEIWKERISPEHKIESEIIVGHSLGCNWALNYWEKHQDVELILVNPLLPKRKFQEWFLRWREFHLKGNPSKKKQIVSGLRNVIFGAKTCYQLLQKDFDKVLDLIPKEKILIFSGEKDIFYCDDRLKQYIESKNIRFVEVKSVGHDWNEKYDEEIEKIITPS